MKRPKRYPYTKNQWEEETTVVQTFDDKQYLLIKTLENRFTGERVLANSKKHLSKKMRK